ncbi:MAG: bifunctional aspartate kinase/homoserine dehydrogenase I [Paludibacteraceae bacterium]|jgi:aspartokinase/homoserine dehydrogenase 1|nr:bifunctional aspartate kinase/homoserine dehydrogenase I [Paludibacteraceae bacterium]
MKVLKFGGASVGSIKNLQQVKKIIEGVNEPAVIVVSAMAGVTDRLIKTSTLAAEGTLSYVDEFKEIVNTHKHIVEGIIPTSLQEATLADVAVLHGELENILKGVFLIKDLTRKTENAILSYGERISSLLISRFVDAQLVDSRKFIKTIGGNDAAVDFDASYRLIQDAFSVVNQRVVVPGFIASAVDSNEVTTLGRGGSDYTAALIGAALRVREIDIWTTSQGFMTADPQVISKAYPIKRLSYTEAMELCNFGARAIFPPTLYPASSENIPIHICNISAPEAEGTVISNERDANDKTIKGISSISDTALLSIQGMGLLNVPSVNGRIFSALAANDIRTLFVSQASSGSSISVGVKAEDANNAVELLNREFAREKTQGALSAIVAQKELSIIAIVGDNMKQNTGTAGQLCNALGRNNINIIAMAQGSSETNISVVVTKDNLRKALNSIHESFFLSDYQELNLFVVGTGNIGGSLLEQFRTQADLLMNQNRLKARVIGIADVKHYILNRDGVDLTRYRDLLQTEGMASSPETLKNALIDLNIYNCVFVDCTASAGIASIYKDLLLHNISVVAANKIAASSEYKNYIELKNIARRKGIKYLFETNVGAGLPIINTINDLIYSGDRILKLEAVLSGTLNFIFNTISKDIPLSKAIRMAMEARFAEPDPRIDLSGTDVIRKLVILARESGCVVEQTDVEKHLFIPEDFFEGSLDEFWKKVEGFDAEFEKKRLVLEQEHKRWRFVAKLEDGKTSVGLVAVDQRSPFYDLEGSNNVILITTARYKQDPMMIKGYGAGAAVTAAGVFADVISIANIR